MNDKEERIERALEFLSPHLRDCRLCPRDCGVDRRSGKRGFCDTAGEISLSRALLHFGEEPVLSGCEDCRAQAEGCRSGSGTLFVSGCNLKCLFCQNHQISWSVSHSPTSTLILAEAMLDLQERGALNINWVSPTHSLPGLLRGLREAVRRGLHLPLVYNSNGYERAPVVQRLEGIVDIYLPDIKFFSGVISSRLTGVSDYFSQASSAVEEMYCQQPRMEYAEGGTALKGLIIRHLVLPGCVDDSLHILDWIADRLSTSVPLSLMSQYFPCFRAPDGFQRKINAEEYRAVVRYAGKCGFENLFLQPPSFNDGEHRNPDFKKNDPFNWD
ncbi:MAG: hypothetical protein MUP70_05845 [Candidatus Aminicenantes bacterium]|nr:hypothetical protein [Candidatus Aminicenantes bacterium]